MRTQTTPDPAHQARLDAGQACLDAAINVYLPLGLAVTWCCDPAHIGVGRKHAKECQDPGKGPMHPWKVFQQRLPTVEEVQTQFHRYPIGNVGCVLGQVSGLVRIDEDGQAGCDMLAAWSGGDLPPPGPSAVGRGGAACSTGGRRMSPVRPPPIRRKARMKNCA